MNLYRDEYGDATSPRTILLLHGLFGSAENLRPVGKALSETSRVVALDLPGHGRSPHGPLSYESMAAAVAETAGDLGPPVQLLGHSMGGKVAMTTALLYPELVDRLVVVDIAPVMDPPRHREIIEAQRAAAGAGDRREADRIMAEHIPEDFVRAFLLKNFVADNGQYHWRHALDEIAAAYEKILGFPGIDGVFDGPALFVLGEHSSYVDADGREEIRLRFPSARIETLAGAGHWVHADRPEEFRRVVEEFVLA